MRRSSWMLISIAMLAAVIALAAYAQCPLGKTEGRPKCEEWVKCEIGPMCCPEYCQALKGAKVDVDNIDGGVIVTITTDNPTSASLIQQYWAKVKESLESGKFTCPYTKGSAKKSMMEKKPGDWKAKKTGKKTPGDATECQQSPKGSTCPLLQQSEK